MTETEKLKNALFQFERATGCKVMQIRISAPMVNKLAGQNAKSDRYSFNPNRPMTFNGVALSIGEW